MRTLTFNRIIGAGAMGTVYHAELKAPGGFVRPCAVKVMRASGPDREHFMMRMRDEARLLGMLQDEAILGVSELVRVGEFDAVVMEYVEGVDLGDVIKHGHKVAPRALAELGAEIAGTLGRAHTAKHPSTGQALNVIHRDIKPANVMVTVRGSVRLLDFGVARAAFSDRESQTQGLVLGTLNYFPPEVLAGNDPTPAVDLYGLGLTMWECAAGRDWGTPQAQQKKFEKRVEQRLSELPPEYAELIPAMRALLQWDPIQRPDGLVAERQLLTAAGKLAGDPLRVWARDAIGAMVAIRESESKGRTDELIGKSMEVQSLGLASDQEASSARSMPAEVKAASQEAAPPPDKPIAKAPKASKPRSRSSTGILGLLAVGVLLGVIVGLVALLVVAIGLIIAMQ